MTTAHPAELKALGQTIRELRETAGLTANEVSMRSGLGDDALACIERGEQDIRLLELVALAEALNTTTEALLARAKL